MPPKGHAHNHPSGLERRAATGHSRTAAGMGPELPLTLRERRIEAPGQVSVSRWVSFSASVQASATTETATM